MIDVEGWAEIRRLHRAEQMSIRAIAKPLRIARNTVRAALRSETAPKYERTRAGSAVDAVDGEVRALLAEFPSMPATVIAPTRFQDTIIGCPAGLTFGARVTGIWPVVGSRHLWSGPGRDRSRAITV
jgi:transposase